MTNRQNTTTSGRLARRAARLAIGSVAMCIASAGYATPWEVPNEKDWDYVRANPTEDYILTSDVDLGGATWTPIGTAMAPFTGSFDGDGHIVSDFVVGSCAEGDLSVAEFSTLWSSHHAGFFGYTDGAVISNLTLEDALVGALTEVGVLIADARDTTITNCIVEGTACGHGQVGGLVGFMGDSEVRDCIANVDVNLIRHITIESTPYDLESSGVASTAKWFGGFVGHAHPFDAPGRVVYPSGGISTGDGNLIVDCHAYGDVHGSWGVGGFAGNFHGSVAIGCSASGDVDSDFTDAGGFAGFIQNEPGVEETPIPRKTEIIGCSASGRVIARDYDDGGIAQGISKVFPGQGGFIGYCEGGLDSNDEPTVFIADCAARGDTYMLEDDTSDPTGTGGFVGSTDQDTLFLHSRAFGGVFGSGLYFLEDDPTPALQYVGGFVGASAGRYENCIAAGRVEGGHRVGGFAGGLNVYSSITTYSLKYLNCEAHGDVQSFGIGANEVAGGFMGSAALSEFTDCEAHGNLTGDDYQAGGGFVGESIGDMTRCAALGNVLADDGIVGGFSGTLSGSTAVQACFARGDVVLLSPTGSADIGGFAGSISSASVTVDDCYAAGLVASSTGDIGGFVGSSASPTYASCYWDTDTSGQSGSQPTNVNGLTLSQMRQQSSFTGFDFSGDWAIFETVSYPYLK